MRCGFVVIGTGPRSPLVRRTELSTHALQGNRSLYRSKSLLPELSAGIEESTPNTTDSSQMYVQVRQSRLKQRWQ